MADIKSLIQERVERGGTIANKVVIRNVAFGEEDNNGRSTAIVHLNQRVPRMLKIDAAYVAKAEEKAVAAENAAKISGASDDVKAEAIKLREYCNSLVIGEWYVGESDVIFVSNFELFGIIRNDVRTAAIADILITSNDLLKQVFIWATCSVLSEPISEGELYQGLFSENVSVVKRNSIFHTLLNLKFNEEAEDVIADLKADYRKMLLKEAMKKMRGGKKRRSRDRDDDDAQD